MTTATPCPPPASTPLRALHTSTRPSATTPRERGALTPVLQVRKRRHRLGSTHKLTLQSQHSTPGPMCSQRCCPDSHGHRQGDTCVCMYTSASSHQGKCRRQANCRRGCLREGVFMLEDGRTTEQTRKFQKSRLLKSRQGSRQVR